MTVMMDSMDYYDARELFAIGDCVSWEGEAALSQGIQIFTGHKTSHISMLLAQIREAQARWLVMEAWEGGHGLLSGEVGDNFLSSKLRGYNNGRCIWRALHPSLAPYRDAIVGRLWHYMGIEYDYRSLVRQVGGRVLVDRKSFFCSELAQVALREGIPREVLANFPWNDEMRLLVDCRIAMQPGDFENLPILMTGIELKMEV